MSEAVVPTVTTLEHWDSVRRHLGTETTERHVNRIEYLDDGEPAVTELFSVEALDEGMWLVCGIYEPAGPHDPWTIAHVSRHQGCVVLHNPPRLVAQESVYRVHDGVDFD